MVQVLKLIGIVFAIQALPCNAFAEEALPEQAMPTISVSLLGTGSPIPTRERQGPSVLVETRDGSFIFDAGRGIVEQLWNPDYPSYAKYDKLFLTHLHSDHIVGLPDLWLTGWIFGRRSMPLRIWGPKGVKNMMNNLEGAFEFDIRVRSEMDTRYDKAGVQAEVTEIHEGVVYEDGCTKVTAFLVDHEPIEPAFGYRIECDGHSVVLSGDTKYSENLLKFSEGADVVIHEVAMASSGALESADIRNTLAHHTQPAEAGMVFRRISPKLALYYHIVLMGSNETELVNATRATYGGPLLVGEDRMKIDIDKGITITKM